MHKFDSHREKGQNAYNWQGVMQFLYNQYQHSNQKENIWALERSNLKQNIKQLQGSYVSQQRKTIGFINDQQIAKIQKHYIRKCIKTNELFFYLQKRIKNHQNRNKFHESQQKQNNEQNAQRIQDLPKVPQRRPKPNKANLSRMLCSLGIPQLLQDIKKDIQHHQTQQLMHGKPDIKKGLQLNLSKIQAQSTEQFKDRKISYQVACTLQGHHDGVRDACFLNYSNQLKQIVSVSEDCTMKIWEIKKHTLNKIQKAECIETVRDHSGPIFTCMQGDGYVFTGGMQGIIRAYNFKNHSTDKKHLAMKWKANDDDKLEPIWQLLYDKTNKLLITTCSQMEIRAYKIPQLQEQKISSNLKMKAHCKFLYHPNKNIQSQDYQQFIPTAVCLYNSNLVASYFNSSSLVHYDLETQKIVNQLNYQIQGNLSANKLVSHPRCVIGAYQDCNIRMFDQRKIVECFKAHKQAVMSVSLHWNNANYLFSCSQDGYVRLWDIRNLKEHIWQTLGHNKKSDEAAHCIQTNFDGITVSGGADSLLKVYVPSL